MQTRKQIFKSALLGVLAITLLNFPFLSIPDKVALFLSVPVLYVYVFGIWLLLILALLVLIDRKKVSERRGR
jgi:hypothetical protein